MGASVFLNVVTIGAGVLMICVASSILYNKWHDISDEFREIMSRRRQNGHEEQQQQEVTVEKDVEAAVHAPPPPPEEEEVMEEENVERVSMARIKRKRSIRPQRVPTQKQENVVEEDWKKEALEIAARRQAEESGFHPTSFLHQPQESYQRSKTANQGDNNINNADHDIDVDSIADSCSCYLENSPTKDLSFLLSKSTASAALNTTTQLHQQLLGRQQQQNLDDISCMDYSVDSSMMMMMESKESFSSFAKPNVTMMMMDETTLDYQEDNTTTDPAIGNISSRLPHSPFGKTSNSLHLTTKNHLDDVESVETSVVPSSVATSNEESDQYSMVKPSVLSFPSRNTSDATSTTHKTTHNKDRMVVHVSPATETNVSPLRTTNTNNNKPKKSMFVRNGNSALTVEILGDDDDEDSSAAEDCEFDWMKTKAVTPDTVETAGMWSPSSDVAKHDAANDSFTSNNSSLDDAETLQVIQKEALNECFAPFYASHSVHVCRSASCTTCRNPQQNEPIFLNATKTSTGQNYNLSKLLPKRWWTTQQADDVGKLKDYVSNVLMAQRQQHQRDHSAAGLDGSMESHPFDEAY